MITKYRKYNRYRFQFLQEYNYTIQKYRVCVQNNKYNYRDDIII